MRTDAVWLAASIVGCARATLRSAVYVSGPSVQSEQIGSEAPSISFDDAQVYLAERLNVADTYSLGGVQSTVLGLLNQIQGSAQRVFGDVKGREEVRRTLVIVEGLDDPEGRRRRLITMKSSTNAVYRVARLKCRASLLYRPGTVPWR